MQVRDREVEQTLATLVVAVAVLYLLVGAYLVFGILTRIL